MALVMKSFIRDEIPGPVKSNGNIIGVRETTYKTTEIYIDIREYYPSPDTMRTSPPDRPGETYCPSPRGCRFPLTTAHVEEMIEALAKVAGLDVTVKPKKK